MATDTIIKIILAAPFVALVLWAIRLRLRLKKMGVKKVYNRPYSDREDEELKPGGFRPGYSKSDEFLMPGGLFRDN